jgi:hypothetical protein
MLNPNDADDGTGSESAEVHQVGVFLTVAEISGTRRRRRFISP